MKTNEDEVVILVYNEDKRKRGCDISNNEDKRRRGCDISSTMKTNENEVVILV